MLPILIRERTASKAEFSTLLDVFFICSAYSELDTAILDWICGQSIYVETNLSIKFSIRTYMTFNSIGPWFNLLALKVFNFAIHFIAL